MPEYSFLTTWCLEAPREQVWDAIWDSERWPDWWRGVVASTHLAEGDETGLGQVGRYTWRSKLPYDLDFEMTTTRVRQAAPARGPGRRASWPGSAAGGCSRRTGVPAMGP